MVLYLLYIIFLYYISIYIINRAHAGEVVLQCYNATLFSTRRKGLSHQRNPLPTRTSPRISAKPPQQLPPRKMVASPRFSVFVVAKKDAFSPPKTRLSDEKDTQKRYKNALAWYVFAHFTHQKKHFFWRVKQRQPPDFCPVFDTQNRKIAKKRCRFYVAPPASA